MSIFPSAAGFTLTGCNFTIVNNPITQDVVMQQPLKVDNSENDLLYPLSHSYDITSSSASPEMFSEPSPLSHLRECFTPLNMAPRRLPTISTSRRHHAYFDGDQETHPSLDLYKTNHGAGALWQTEKSTQFNLPPPSPLNTHRFSTTSTSRGHPRSHAYSDGIEEAHPFYETKHTVGPLRQTEKSTPLNITPPSPLNTQRLPTISNSRGHPWSHAYSDGNEEAHPLHEAIHTAGPLWQSEPTQMNIMPPSQLRAQRLPAISTSGRRSRSHSHAYSAGGEEALDGPPPEDATEQEKVAWRRRQTALAARKSRKRKQDLLQRLQDDVQQLSKERDVWRERALMMKQLIISHGIPSPNFER